MSKAEQMHALVRRIDKGDPSPEDLQLLHQEFDQHPDLYRNIGNIGKNIFEAVLKDAGNNSVFFQECAEKNIDEMKTKLGYHSSTFVEQLLIDEILMRWLRLQLIENEHHKTLRNDHTPETGIYYDKLLNNAHKGFLRSVETLARVRKMIAQTQAKGAEMFKTLISKPV